MAIFFGRLGSWFGVLGGAGSSGVTDPAAALDNELREDGGYELREDGGYELRE